ncbi:glycosyltransferase family 1 protein [Mucilaginibacter sp. L196]|uniref:glycosyltransferase family 4 protein n=1 Tax=Mucilaginibacter sp. L196 TaxID=1641870 RepID=UPI00131C7718|nr:glycosyltransferase family 1 protein [Mucilaginibacter sp. L196]
MKIAIDGRPLQGQLSGVGKYVLKLVLSLAERMPDAAIVIFTNKPLDISFTSSNIVVKQDSKFEKIKPLIWSKFFLGRLLRREKFDYQLFGGTFTPLQKSAGKKIVVVHDLNHIYARETMSKLHLLTHILFFKNDIKNADYVISNSHGTAKKLEKEYNIEANYILHPPIDASYKVIAEANIKAVLLNLNIKYPYVLTVATQEPRKNLVKTVEVFLQLKKDNRINGHKLVLAGSKGWKNTNLQRLINQDDDIIQLGYVAEEHLPYIYNGASCFVFPSKYEGYGMPASEAVLCGLKPVVTDITELHEAVAEYAYFIDPENKSQYIDSIINCIASQQHFNTSAANKLRKSYEVEFTGFVKKLKLI